MIALYSADIRQIAPFSEALFETLCPARRAAAARYRLPEDRLRALAGGLLMRAVLGTDDVLIAPGGKPHLPGGPEFSLSHSGDYAVLATSETPVGVDIERVRTENFDGLARVAFHPAERAALVCSNHPMDTFFALWTLKESYMKADGRGFAMGGKSFCIRLLGDSACLPSDESIRFFRFFDFPGYALSVCSKDETRAPAVSLLNFKE